MDGNTSNHRRRSSHNREDDRGDTNNRGDPAVWAAFSDNFHEVQSVLDRNRLLIQQVNENHQSKIPNNMVKNVALIQEINGNISKVASLYSNLSSEFMAAAVNHRNAGKSNSESEDKQ